MKQAVHHNTARGNRIDDLNDQLAEAITDRDAADSAPAAKIQLAVAGVLADPTEGPDSTLYEAFGYTRKSAASSASHAGATNHPRPKREMNQPPETQHASA